MMKIAAEDQIILYRNEPFIYCLYLYIYMMLLLLLSALKYIRIKYLNTICRVFTINRSVKF